MARAPRAWQAGLYDLATHGSDERHLFLSEGERELFLDGQTVSDTDFGHGAQALVLSRPV